MELIDQYESRARDAAARGDAVGCIKACFACASVNPELVWEYELAGGSYMGLGMHSQAMGCFAVAAELETDPARRENFERLIGLCGARDREAGRGHRA